jgi:hypothetical protein
MGVREHGAYFYRMTASELASVICVCVRKINGRWAMSNICVSLRTSVVEGLCYKLVGRGFDSRWCHQQRTQEFCLGVQQIQLRTECRGNVDLGAVAP